MMSTEDMQDQSDSTSPEGDGGFGPDKPLIMPDVDPEAALRAFMEVDPDLFREDEEEPEGSQTVDKQEDTSDDG